MALDTAVQIVTLMSACVCGAPAVSLSAPSSVSALEGSCVLIPCSFGPSQRRMELRLTRPSDSFWTTLRRTVFSSHRGEPLHPDFRDRTALAGNMSAGNCSISIRGVKMADQNTYELQIREQGQRSWPAGARVNLTVTSEAPAPELSDPGLVQEGQRVRINCSVQIGCPADRPRLRWRWERGEPDGGGDHGDVELSGTLLWTSLSFTVPKHGSPRVSCEVEYPQRRRAAASRDILVHFPPRDVTVQILTALVRVGGSALLSCSCKADPPVLEYQWASMESGITQILPKRTHNIRIYNVTRDTRVQCSVANRLGRASSRFTGLKVQYAPVIMSNSSCVWDGSLLSCRCVVDSNPRPAVTWSVNGSLPDGFNLSSSYFSPILTAVLSGSAHAPLPVRCYAVNALGNDSRPLLELHDGFLLWTVIPTACAVLFLLLLFLLLCFCSRTNRQRRVMAYRRPVVHGIYQERMPLYINCSEVTNIYSNGSYQLVYQNCTPCFVRAKQINKRQRRGARRQRNTTPATANTHPDNGIYVEVM